MNDLQEVEQQAPVATASNSDAIISVIERAATNPDVDIDKMERLLQMHERIQSRQAEQLFNQAMTEAQEGMGTVRADAENKQTRSKYATYAAIDRALRPIYTKHGFAVSYDTGADSPEAHITVLAHVMHRSGHSKTYRADMPADGKGAKGGDVMTKTHATGAAMSYGMRYLLKMIFNVSVGEDDNDGNTVVPTITEQQMTELVDLAESVGADREKFCRYHKIKSFADIRASDFEAAKASLNAKRKPS